MIFIWERKEFHDWKSTFNLNVNIRKEVTIHDTTGTLGRSWLGSGPAVRKVSSSESTPRMWAFTRLLYSSYTVCPGLYSRR